MMLNKEETHLYICKYCQIEFKPRRRRVQKFCTANCRSKNWFMVHSKDKVSPIPIQPNETGVSLKTEKKKGKKKKPTKVEKISTAGIGNAALGTLAVNTLTNFLTKDENKPITQAQMMSLLPNIQRFQKVNNIAPNEYGQLPFIDITTGNVEYIGKKDSFLDI